MTNQKLKEIRARLDAATPGPWIKAQNENYYDGMWLTARGWETPFISDKYNAHKDDAIGMQVDINMELIANAPTDIAYLLTVIDKQSRVIELCLERADTKDGTIFDEVDQILSEGE